jgi:hypothetical protein
VIFALVATTGTARAGGDNRPEDRFSFAIAAGMVSSGTELAPMSPDTSPGVVLETSYWPNDFAGLGYSLEYLAVPATTTSAASTNLGTGFSAMAALPLRYVQLYAGGWIGARYNFVDGDSRGLHWTVYPLAGVNLYVNRNLRVFGQVQSVALEEVGDGRAQLVAIGARWSPDAFHRQRGATKFSIVWTSLLAGVAVFAGASYLVSRGD